MDESDIITTLREYFLSSTRKMGDCVQWTGYYNINHEPRVFLIGRWMPARNLSFLLFRGPIPRGYRPLPTCGDQTCVEPQHQALVEVVQKIEAKRIPTAIKPSTTPAKGRTRAVSTNPNRSGKLTSLSEAEKQSIIDRATSGPKGTQKLLADEYNVSAAAMSTFLKNANENLIVSSQPLGTAVTVAPDENSQVFEESVEEEIEDAESTVE